MTSSKNIMIIEDSTDHQLLLSKFLADEGYTFSLASNGEQALTLLRNMSPLPSLILLDIMMPVMDGLSFRKEQLLDPRLASIKVIVMTADSINENKVQDLKAVRILRKPILDLDDLLETVRSHA